MARRKAKIAWGKICFWLATAVLFGLVVWINVNRFNHNIYANYEKAVDYGRVREEKVAIAPVIAAIFYADKNTNDGHMAAYLDHAVNYKKQHVKIVMVPRFLMSESLEVVEKLYNEINKHNEIKQAILIYNQPGHLQKHLALLQKDMVSQTIKTVKLEDNDTETDAEIENYLQQEGNLLVVLTDLTEEFNDNFLVQKIILWAQKYHYNMSVFDVIDTKIAESVDKNYAALLTLSDNAEETWQARQKHNLEQYVRRYGASLRHWFTLNIERAKQNLPPMWPLKSAETYRLYDRGTLYTEVGQFEKLVDNQGIVVALVRMAQRFVHKNVSAVGAKLYLLTENEEIRPWTSELDDDDGIYLRYKSHKAVVLPEQRPDDWRQLTNLLRHKAKINDDADAADFKFYRFKAVEISDEN